MDNTREIEELDAGELRELFAATPKWDRRWHQIYGALKKLGIDGREALATRRADRKDAKESQ